MRRVIVLLCLLAAMWPAATLAFPVPSIRPPLPVMGYDQAARVFLKLNRAWDATPAADKRPVITDAASARVWANEILPYYVTEGVVGPDNLIAPTSISYQWYTDPSDAFHLIGTTGFCSSDVRFNQRIITPGDPWFTSDIQLVVLAHELAHVQGVCDPATPLNDEVSAQLVSWEVVAAMANDGCAPCRASLLADLRHRELGAVEAAAVLEHRGADLARLEAATLTPAERAHEARSVREWATGDQVEEARILYNYYTVPMSAWVDALAAGQDHVDGVDLPVNIFQSDVPPWLAKPLVIDDLAYFYRALS